MRRPRHEAYDGGVGIELFTPTHLIFLGILALLLFGPKRLPEIGRSLGNGIREFKSTVDGLGVTDAVQSANEVRSGRLADEHRARRDPGYRGGAGHGRRSARGRSRRQQSRTVGGCGTRRRSGSRHRPGSGHGRGSGCNPGSGRARGQLVH